MQSLNKLNNSYTSKTDWQVLGFTRICDIFCFCLLLNTEKQKMKPVCFCTFPSTPSFLINCFYFSRRTAYARSVFFQELDGLWIHKPGRAVYDHKHLT